MKICNKCNIEKSLEEYYPKKSGKLKVMAHCKSCHKRINAHNYKADSTNRRMWQSLHSASLTKEQKDKQRTRVRNWKREHPNRVKQYYMKDYSKNKARFVNDSAKRRSLIKNAGSFTEHEWKAKLEEFNSCCAYCLSFNVNLTVDHMQPLSRGGMNTIDNIVPACRSCNCTKHARDLVQFVQAGALNFIGKN